MVWLPSTLNTRAKRTRSHEDSPRRKRGQTTGVRMILYVVTDSWEDYRQTPRQVKVRNTLEALCEDYCTVLHYSAIQPSVLQELKPWAICHGGGSHGGGLHHSGYRWCVTELDTPQLGICAGHQLAAIMFGSYIGPMRSLDEGEIDMAPDYSPGEFKEVGLHRVEIIKNDPLFHGFRDSLIVMQRHRYHILDLSPQLLPLAKTKECPIQAWVHQRKPVYGVQFHPERDPEPAGDGATILRNFFHIARSYSADTASPRETA